MMNLVDNDIALKLAQYSLVEEFVSLNGNYAETYILPTLKYRFRLHDDAAALQSVGNSDALENLRDFVKQVNELHEEAPLELLSELVSLDLIDPGEAVLFALGSKHVGSTIFTGDKRAVANLSHKSCPLVIATALRGRIKCLEQVVAEMVLRLPARQIVDKVSGQHWDIALRICFGSSSHQEIVAGLRSYYHDLNERCGLLLAPFPEI